jgi:hypothetical protein
MVESDTDNPRRRMGETSDRRRVPPEAILRLPKMGIATDAATATVTDEASRVIVGGDERERSEFGIKSRW